MPAQPVQIRRTGRAGGLVMRDGLANVVAGIGGTGDKRVYDRFTFTAPVGPGEAEAAYRTSWLARKVHDLPPFDETREWRCWQASDEEIEALEAEERRLCLRARVQEARRWARLYGGAAIVLGAPQGDPALPLNLAALRLGGLRYLHVVTRHQLSIPEIETDPESEFFGQPKFYELASAERGANVRIHPSRVVAFVGQAVPKGALGITGADAFWGDPLLTSLRDAIANADLAQAIVASLLHEAKVDTLKIPDLAAGLATAEYEQRLIGRLNVANLAKSVLNTRILDAGETWETRQISFASLPEVLDKFLQIVAGAADIPITRLLGSAAKGLNATGKGDNDNYDEMISARQETELRPLLERIDEAMIRSALGGARPPQIHFTFAPLAKPDPREIAEIEEKRAATARSYVESGLVPAAAMAKAVQNTLVEASVYPGLEAALAEAPGATAGLNVELFKTLMAAWQAGAAPKEALFERLVEAGLLPEGMETFEDFAEAIEAEGEALGMIGQGDDDLDEEDEDNEGGGRDAGALF